MNSKCIANRIGLFMPVLLSMIVLTSCLLYDRDKSYPHKIVIPSEGDTIISDLDFKRFGVVNTIPEPEDIFLISCYDTIYGSKWLKVEVSSKDKTTRFMVEPNTTGEKRQFTLFRQGPDFTEVEIIQKK